MLTTEQVVGSSGFLSSNPPSTLEGWGSTIWNADYT